MFGGQLTSVGGHPPAVFGALGPGPCGPARGGGPTTVVAHAHVTPHVLLHSAHRPGESRAFGRSGNRLVRTCHRRPPLRDSRLERHNLRFGGKKKKK